MEWSYWSRKENHKMVISESIVVSRRKIEDDSNVKEVQDKSRIGKGTGKGNKNKKNAIEILESMNDKETKSICTLFTNSFGTKTTKWPEVLLFGGGATDTVARLAESNGKKVLYKPSGKMLNNIMKSHQKPSINDMKELWHQQCQKLNHQINVAKNADGFHDVSDAVDAANAVNAVTKLKTQIVRVGGVGQGIEIKIGGHGVNNWVTDVIVLIVVLLLVGIFRYISKGKRRRGKSV